MKKTIVFVYSGGREKRVADALRGDVPSEFFYGAVEFPTSDWEMRMIDFHDNPGSRIAALGNRLFGRFFPVRVRAEHLLGAMRLLPRLNDASVVVATSSYLALALGYLRAFGFSVPPVVAIHCGLANHPPRGLKLRLTSRLLRKQRNVFFSPGEAAETAECFALPEMDMIPNPFGVDLNFWCPSENPQAGEYVLAVGNDARRDYDVLLRAADKLRMPFRIITSRQLPTPLPPNVEWLQGNWHRPAVTDLELRELYRRARVVVVPLTDSPQPSGQSVALQAMACGRAVVMTRTRGLWTGDDFVDGEHLCLIPPGNPEALATAVLKLADEPGFAGKLGLQAQQRVMERGDIQKFSERLQTLCTQAATWQRR